MFKLSRMKSLITLAPAFSNSTGTAPFSFNFHCQPAVLLRRTTNSYAYHCVSSVSIANCIPSRPILSNYNQNRKIRTQSGTSGEIHVIVGPMFAGKTTTLLKRMKLASSNGSSVAIIKSDKDNRYAVDSIVTHDGEKLPCVPLANLSSFREKLGVEAYEKIDVIGIDEAQFFGDLYEFCCKAADRDGKTLIVAGLDGDYLRRSFGSVLDIIPIADSVTKLTARCEVCNQPALFTLRKTAEIKTEVIAGADVYMPVCRKHYTSGQMVKDATKAVIESQNMQISSVL